MIDLSVIIPVKNGEATLSKCLSSIKRQSNSDSIEIIILDSCSSDKSIEIANRFGAKVINIHNGTFDHGLTRNLGVSYAATQIVYFTVQDAYLAEDDQLERMINHFEDLELQAVVGMQATPHDKEKNPAKWFRRYTKPNVSFRHFPDGGFSKLPLQEQFNYCSWDNVNAMYRTSALRKIPFIKTNFAEDWVWVKNALGARMKIAFDPSLVVYHYHHKDFNYSFRVQYTLNYNFFKEFNIYPAIPAYIKPVLTDSYLIWKNNQISIREKLYWNIHNFSGSTAVLLSHVTFLIAGKIFGKAVLNKSFKLFCGVIPQGKIKNFR